MTTFKRLRTTKQQVVLAQGQFFSASPTDGLAGGTQRLFTHEHGIVFSSPSNDYAPPVFSTLEAQVLAGGQVAFAVGVTDRDGVSAGVVKRVVVAYKDARGRKRLALRRPRAVGARLRAAGRALRRSAGHICSTSSRRSTRTATSP